LFQACNSSDKQLVRENIDIIDFENPKSIKFSDILSEYECVLLETSDESLFSKISQIEISGGKIYILDNYKSNALFVFSEDGKFINKIEAKGNGPGEFLLPHSFWIEGNNYIFILDRYQDRLLKYSLIDFEFIEQIVLPASAPLSFSVYNMDDDLFIYYFPFRENNKIENKQLVIADKEGVIKKKLLDASSSGKILHGNPNNFYLYNNALHFYPYFSNHIYTIQGDSMTLCYQLYWGKYNIPTDDYFTKYNDSGELMDNLLTGSDEYIRLIYVYETDENLLVKYYIKKDFYIAIWDKNSHAVVNTKYNEMVDDMGLGDVFPLPVGATKEMFIGAIELSDMNSDIDYKLISKWIDHVSNDGNPILVLYKLKKLLP
jgi:hypothetical protein